MKAVKINWEVEIEGQNLETEFEDLVQMLQKGKISPVTKVRRDSLRWVEIQDIPLLMKAMQNPNFAHENSNSRFESRTYAPPRRKTIYEPEIYDQSGTANNQTGKNMFSVVGKLVIVLVFSAVISFCWLQYANYQKWNAPETLTLASSAEIPTPGAIEQLRRLEKDYKADESKFSKSYTDNGTEKYRRAENFRTKKANLENRILKESTMEFFSNLSITFLLLGLFVIASHQRSK